jgi:glucose-1-phosphate thymidylyltransferase
MKGVILAGGTGSRLTPLTKVTNKHLLPIGRRPMIIHAVNKLVESGIDDIMVITGTEHMGDMITLLGSGHDYGCSFTFRVQDQPDGIAGALLLCESFAANDSILVILGDNIFEDDLKEIVEKFESRSSGSSPACLLCLKTVEDPHRFGVPEIINNSIVRIVEKPKEPPSNYCVTGIYVYDSNVFDFIRTLQKSDRGEYEITDVNNAYIKKGLAAAHVITGWWTDAGTHPSYHLANKLVQD